MEPLTRITSPGCAFEAEIEIPSGTSRRRRRASIFSLLVHRIHDGVNMLADGGSYTVVGFGGSHNDFSTTLFPAMSPKGKGGRPRQLLSVSCEGIGGESAGRLVQRGEPAGMDEPGRRHRHCLLGLPRRQGRGRAFLDEHVPVLWRELYGLSSDGRHVRCRQTSCPVLKRRSANRTPQHAEGR